MNGPRTVIGGWPDPTFRKGLEAGFPGWGPAAHHPWYLGRDGGAGPPRLVSLQKGGTAVAGICLNPREVTIPGGGRLRAAILTSAWTRPEHRRRGLFEAVIEACLHHGAEIGLDVLLGLMTARNASRKGLAALGSREVVSGYLVATETFRATASPADRSMRWRSVPSTDAVARELREWPDPGDEARIVYPTAEAWRSQFLDRPLPTEVMEADEGTLAILERATETDRLLLVRPRAAWARAAEGLASRAAAAGRRFFCYSTDPGERRIARSLGLEERPGRLSILDVPGGRNLPEPAARWRLDGGDRM